MRFHKRQSIRNLYNPSVTQIKTVKKIKKAVKVPTESTRTSDPVELPDYDRRFATIREHIREIDPIDEWNDIREYLEVKPELIQDIRAQVRDHADITTRAKNLALMANTEYEEFVLKYRDRKQLWRNAAMEHWQSEKERGLHKQITEQMLEDWMIENHSDLYMELQKRKLHLEEIRDRLKGLATQVSGKGQDLRKLLESETRRPAGLPGWADDDKK
jgi:hypothetical protein